MESTIDRNAGLSVNFHLIEACNAHCTYCFATFPHLKKKNRLLATSRMKLIDLLVDGGFGKINFAGGEPTLVRDLGALCERIKKRSQDRCAVSIVSNGKRLQQLIDDAVQWIDWVALSLDSGSDVVNAALGRTGRKVPYVSKILALGEALKSHGVRIKCNTVVTTHNVHEDMSSVMERLSPERWKLFQVLPVAGENDRHIADLKISKEKFQEFVRRHLHLRGKGVEIVPEDNAHMTNTYLMISPDGCFFWHTPNGGLQYGAPILEVGLVEALKQVRFSEEKFHARGAVYDWQRRWASTALIRPLGTRA